MSAKAITASEIKQEKAKRKKKRIKYGALGTVLLLLIWLVFYLFAPYKSGPLFGVCKTFLELYVQFPQYLRLSEVDDFGDRVRIWYTQVDSFGVYRLEPIECKFRQPIDEDKISFGDVKFILESVTINRREIDPDRVERFNAALVNLAINPPDLTIPFPLPDSLENLQIDTSLFRKPIL